MYAVLTLLLLIAPVLLMIWMMIAQRKARALMRSHRSEQGAAHTPWHEDERAQDGLVYSRAQNHNPELSEASDQVEDAKRIQILGTGL